MRANIIFHSVSGNLYIIADTFREALSRNGIDARLYRIDDPDLHLLANERNDVNEYYEDIMDLPTATNEKLLNADLILLGVPSIFGMPSAEMKAFLDGTMDLYDRKALKGRKFWTFSTSRISYGDALDAVESAEHWADRMGLEPLDFPPYTHKDGIMMPNRPGEELNVTAERLASAARSLL